MEIRHFNARRAEEERRKAAAASSDEARRGHQALAEIFEARAKAHSDDMPPTRH